MVSMRYNNGFELLLVSFLDTSKDTKVPSFHGIIPSITKNILCIKKYNMYKDILGVR